MTLEIYELLLIGAVALAAGYTQGVTGFGFGIVAMIFLPSLMLYTEANLLSSILGASTALVLAITLYKRINWKNLTFTLIGSFAMNYASIAFMRTAENDTLVLLLGIALILLSVYFFFFSKSIRIRPTWYAALIAGSLSGVMSGLFSIGGPPVVVYYMQSEEDTDSYFATISVYFVISGAASVAMKSFSGMLTLNVLWGLMLGGIGMAAGTLLGKRTGRAIRPETLKKLVYGVMALSGAVNILTVLL